MCSFFKGEDQPLVRPHCLKLGQFYYVKQRFVKSFNSPTVCRLHILGSVHSRCTGASSYIDRYSTPTKIVYVYEPTFIKFPCPIHAYQVVCMCYVLLTVHTQHKIFVNHNVNFIVKRIQCEVQHWRLDFVPTFPFKLQFSCANILSKFILFFLLMNATARSLALSLKYYKTIFSL